VIFLDRDIQPANLQTALEAGGRGYWTVQASSEQLLEAVRQVVAGGSSFCPEAECYVASTPDGPHFHPSTQDTDVDELPARTTRKPEP